MSERQHTASRFLSSGLQVCSGVILCLFLMRYFLVAESAGQGDTLWITGLWFLGLILWGLVTWRSSRPTVDVLDYSVALLAGGHVISAAVILLTSGEKRSALNFAWEWIGIAVAWFLLRQQCRRSDFRRDLVFGLIAIGTVAAGLGLYQHYYEFPELAGKYGPLFDRLKLADPVESKSILQTFSRDGIPTDGPSLILFEKRLRDSREPLGVVALANTLGGFLAVCLILAVHVAATQYFGAGSRRRKTLAGWIAVIGIIGWCLILTKSRTAWIGATLGLAIWVFSYGRIRLNRTVLRVAAGLIIAVGVAFWGIGRLGGLDRQVLTEAPKSLRYRLQYWSATVPMIRDHLWFGVGPGQFRSHYLFCKLPEASEEIADPHNFLLDVAANGGILGFAGLMGLLILLGRLAVRRGANPPHAIPEKSPIAMYCVIAISSVFFVVALVTGTDDRLMVLIPATVGLWLLFRWMGDNTEWNSQTNGAGTLAAAFALLVHLLGAGGIEMPAITLLLLALIAITDAERPSTAKSAPGMSRLWSSTAMMFGMVGAVLLVATSIWPTISTQHQMAAADRLVEQGYLEAADAKYASAATADPLSAEPLRRRAELAHRQALAEPLRSNDSFRNAVRLMREAQARDPSSFQDDRRLGDWWLSRWRRSGDQKDAQEAAAAYQRAVTRYPTNAALLAELAVALESADSVSEARSVAEQAIKQDAVNHEWGHVDRFLADPLRIRLEKMVKEPAKVNILH